MPDRYWRKYIGVYYRLVEAADGHVGRIMEALEQSGQGGNTIIVFTSDHGEMMGAHRQTTKVKFYEEAAAVPLVVCVPGATAKAAVDSTHLVSGLDVLPTMCDYARIAPPASLEGRSLRPLIESRPAPWREYLVSELVAGAPARMVRTARYKYVAYSAGESREQFFDVQADRGETKNLAGDADVAVKAALDEHRRLLKEYCRKTGDPFGTPAAASQAAEAKEAE